MTLDQIYQKHRQGAFPDKGTTHSYIEPYAELLEPYRETAKAILEIGIFGGASMRMWQEYFNGAVYGIDCDEQPHGGMADLRPMIAEGVHNIHIMDASDNKQVKKHFKGIKFDVVIDDASHVLDQQVKTYNNFKPFLNKGAIYIIEDVQDIDKDRWVFESMGATILDRRSVKGRYDDVLIIIKN